MKLAPSHYGNGDLLKEFSDYRIQPVDIVNPGNLELGTRAPTAASPASRSREGSPRAVSQASSISLPRSRSVGVDSELGFGRSPVVLPTTPAGSHSRRSASANSSPDRSHRSWELPRSHSPFPMTVSQPGRAEQTLAPEGEISVDFESAALRLPRSPRGSLSSPGGSQGLGLEEFGYGWRLSTGIPSVAVSNQSSSGASPNRGRPRPQTDLGVARLSSQPHLSIRRSAPTSRSGSAMSGLLDTARRDFPNRSRSAPATSRSSLPPAGNSLQDRGRTHARPGKRTRSQVSPGSELPRAHPSDRRQ